MSDLDVVVQACALETKDILTASYSDTLGQNHHQTPAFPTVKKVNFLKITEHFLFFLTFFYSPQLALDSSSIETHHV